MIKGSKKSGNFIKPQKALRTFISLLAVFLIVFAATFLTGFSTPVFSQEAEIEVDEESETFEDILRQYTQAKQDYESAHGDYVTARSQYLKFRTLKSRNDAREATLNMLELRDEVVILYLRALKQRLIDGVGVPEERLADLTLRLDEEIGFFEAHRSQLSSAATPEDLADDSDKAKAEFDTISPLFYEVLATISYGKTLDLRDRAVDSFSELRLKVDDIRNDAREEYSFSDAKMQLIERSVNESDGRIFRSSEKLIEAENSLNDFRVRGRSRDYEKVLTQLEETRQYLNEALAYMNEVVREIKTAE